MLLHGLAGSWRWWAPVLEPLATRRRVYALDLPRMITTSSGSKELTAWLCGWLEANGLERADIAGHSLGGFVAAELAARRPERVARLVLVAPAGIPCGRGFGSRAFSIFGALYGIRRWLPIVLADAVRTGPLALAGAVAFASRCDIHTELSAVRAPTLLIWGERDRVVPFRIGEAWQRAVPGSRLERVPGGHVPMLEAPNEVAASMLRFLEEELADDGRDESRTRVVDGVGLTGNPDEPTPR
jgi:pimeloyl-ACP methyl ester carboxylesterase